MTRDPLQADADWNRMLEPPERQKRTLHSCRCAVTFVATGIVQFGSAAGEWGPLDERARDALRYPDMYLSPSTEELQASFERLMHTVQASPQYRRMRRRSARAERLTHWMLRIPVLGLLDYVFWHTVLDEGWVAACKPRWGALTFSFLNDGIRPTAWHTWRSVTHQQGDRYTGIYTGGAPASLREAREMEAEWARDDRV